MADPSGRATHGSDSTLQQAALWAGPASIAVTALGTFGAVLLAPWFGWTANALSELGATGQPTAPLFNGGAIVGGLLGVAFAARVWSAGTNAAHRLGVAVMALTFASVALVGIYPLPHERHGTVAILLFVSLTYGLFVHGSGDVLAGRVRRGLASIWLAVAHLTGWLVFAVLPIRGLALPELVGAGALTGWIVLTFRSSRE